VRGYYEFVWFRRRGEDMQNELPVVLWASIVQYKHRYMVSRCPALSNVDAEFTHVLAMLFQSRVATPQEVIFHARDPASHVFFVQVGEVAILTPSYVGACLLPRLAARCWCRHTHTPSPPRSDHASRRGCSTHNTNARPR
jgi:hypothetical protein